MVVAAEGERPVRWVHSSEIADIGPLLQGGELLLTTGLGLAGLSPAEHTRYITDLARRGISGLILELGRTFSRVPTAMVDEARRCALPLIALHGVVPFVEITEAVHRLLVNRRLEVLDSADQMTRDLLDCMLDGGNLEQLVARVGQTTGSDVWLITDSGAIVAATRAAEPPSGGASADIRLRERRWGEIVLDRVATPGVSAMLTRAAVAVGLELLRLGEPREVDDSPVSRFLVDLVGGRAMSLEEFRARAEMAGLEPGRTLARRVVSIGLSGEARRVGHVVAEQIRREFAGSVVGIVSDREVLAVIPTAATDRQLRARLETVDEEFSRQVTLPGTARLTTIIASRAVAQLDTLPTLLDGLSEIRTLSGRLGESSRVLLASDVGVQRLLAHMTDDVLLADFIDEQLGALAAADKSGSLLLTLELFLESGRNKAATARRLGIRRQSVYHRLNRISTLVRQPLEGRESLMPLELAIVARRVRGAGLAASARGAARRQG